MTEHLDLRLNHNKLWYVILPSYNYITFDIILDRNDKFNNPIKLNLGIENMTVWYFNILRFESYFIKNDLVIKIF